MVKMLCLSLFVSLVLCACTPSDNDSGDQPTRAPFGYEFA